MLDDFPTVDKKKKTYCIILLSKSRCARKREGIPVKTENDLLFLQNKKKNETTRWEDEEWNKSIPGYRKRVGVNVMWDFWRMHGSACSRTFKSPERWCNYGSLGRHSTL